MSVDFWVKFDRTGRYAIRPGNLILPDDRNSEWRDRLRMDFVDDQLLTMLRKIYAAFDQDFSEFQSDERVMPLDRYANVGKQLMVIEKIWQDTIRQ